MKDTILSLAGTFATRIQNLEQTTSIKLNTSYPKAVIAFVAVTIITCFTAAIKIINNKLEIRSVSKYLDKYPEDIVKVPKKLYSKLDSIYSQYEKGSLNLYSHRNVRTDNSFFYEKIGYKFYSKSYVIHKYQIKPDPSLGFKSMIYVESGSSMFDKISKLDHVYHVPKLKNSIVVEKSEFDNLMRKEANKIYGDGFAEISIIDISAIRDLDHEINKVKEEKEKDCCFTVTEAFMQKSKLDDLSYTTLGGVYDLNKVYIAHKKGALNECLSKITNVLKS